MALDRRIEKLEDALQRRCERTDAGDDIRAQLLAKLQQQAERTPATPAQRAESVGWARRWQAGSADREQTARVKIADAMANVFLENGQE